jgi:hypothetical protein
MSYIVTSTDWSRFPVSCHCQEVLSAGRQIPPDGTDVGVAGTGVDVAGTGVDVAGTEVAVAGADVAVAGAEVGVAGPDVGVAGTGVGVTVAHARSADWRLIVPVSRVVHVTLRTSPGGSASDWFAAQIVAGTANNAPNKAAAKSEAGRATDIFRLRPIIPDIAVNPISPTTFRNTSAVQQKHTAKVKAKSRL